MSEKKALVVIDMQNDFVKGSLGSSEALSIVDKVVDTIKAHQGLLFFTQDLHPQDYLETQEGKHLPVEHCIEGTWGAQLIEPIDELLDERDHEVIEKPTFGSVRLAEKLKTLYDAGAIDSVLLIGLCTDICVISNALLLKAFMPELPIEVDISCCAGVSPELHEAALLVMKSCQIQIV